jgi:hypothetical protein
LIFSQNPLARWVRGSPLANGWQGDWQSGWQNELARGIAKSVFLRSWRKEEFGKNFWF